MKKLVYILSFFTLFIVNTSYACLLYTAEASEGGGTYTCTGTGSTATAARQSCCENVTVNASWATGTSCNSYSNSIGFTYFYDGGSATASIQSQNITIINEPCSCSSVTSPSPMPANSIPAQDHPDPEVCNGICNDPNSQIYSQVTNAGSSESWCQCNTGYQAIGNSCEANTTCLLETDACQTFCGGVEKVSQFACETQNAIATVTTGCTCKAPDGLDDPENPTIDNNPTSNTENNNTCGSKQVYLTHYGCTDVCYSGDSSGSASDNKCSVNDDGQTGTENQANNDSNTDTQLGGINAELDDINKNVGVGNQHLKDLKTGMDDLRSGIGTANGHLGTIEENTAQTNTLLGGDLTEEITPENLGMTDDLENVNSIDTLPQDIQDIISNVNSNINAEIDRQEASNDSKSNTILTTTKNQLVTALMPSVTYQGGCKLTGVMTYQNESIDFDLCPFIPSFEIVGNLLFLFANLHAIFIFVSILSGVRLT